MRHVHRSILAGLLAGDPAGEADSRTLRRLSPIEEALTLTDAAYPLAVVCLVSFSAAPESDAVARAIEMLERKHPLLGSRIRLRNGSNEFVAPRSYPSLRMRLVPREDDAHAWRVAEDELNRSVDSAEEPLLQALFLAPSAPAGPGELVLRIHHAVIGGDSLGRLLADLLRICAGEELDASAWPLPIEPGFEELLPARHSGVRGMAELAGFMLRELGSELSYRRRLRGRADPPVRPVSRCRIASIALERGVTEALVRSARGRRVTLNGVLTATLLLATHDVLYERAPRPLRAVVWGSLRPLLRRPVDPDQLGAYVTLLRRDVDLDAASDVWSVARQVDGWMAGAARRGELVLGAKISPILMRRFIRRQTERMGAVALSYVGPVALQPKQGPVEVADVHAFITNNPLGPECAAFGHLTFGRLHVDLMLQDADLDRRQASELVSRIYSLLVAASADSEAPHSGAA